MSASEEEEDPCDFWSLDNSPLGDENVASLNSSFYGDLLLEESGDSLLDVVTVGADTNNNNGGENAHQSEPPTASISNYNNDDINNNNNNKRERNEAEEVELRLLFLDCLNTSTEPPQLICPVEKLSLATSYLRVEIAFDSLNRFANFDTIYAYATDGERPSAKRSVAQIEYEGRQYQLFLGTKTNVTGEPYHFVLHRHHSSPVFSLELVLGDATPAKFTQPAVEEPLSDKQVIAQLLKKASGHDAEWTRDFKKAHFGDRAYAYCKLDSSETICVGDVVKSVDRDGTVCVTNCGKGDAIHWWVVANHEVAEGFDSDLPQPYELQNPHDLRSFVPVVTHGIALVRTAGECVLGQWLVARGDGVAVAGSQIPSERTRRLGKAKEVVNGFAFIEVNFEFSAIDIEVGVLNKSETLAADQKVLSILRSGLELQEKGDFEGAIKEYKKGEKKEDAAVATTSLLLQKIGECYFALDKWEKAKRYAKQAVHRSRSLREDPLILLARCYFMLKKHKKARQKLDRAWNLNPAREDVRELKERLDVELLEDAIGGLLREDRNPKVSLQNSVNVMSHRMGSSELKFAQHTVEDWLFKDNKAPFFGGKYTQQLLRMEFLVKHLRYEEALEFGNSLVRERHAGVLFNLAGLYDAGRGLPGKDPCRALVLLRIAVCIPDDGPKRLVGVAEAKGSLAERMLDGYPGVEKDFHGGMKVANEGAVRGAKNAQNVYANYLCRAGKWKAAFGWYRLAATGDVDSGGMGDVAALGNLGCAFFHGRGTPKNWKLAMLYWERAMELGSRVHESVAKLVRERLQQDPELVSAPEKCAELQRFLKVHHPELAQRFAWFDELQTTGPPAPVAGCQLNCALALSYSGPSEYARSLANAFRSWTLGCEMVSRHQDVNGLSEMAKALDVDEIMCPPRAEIEPAIRKCVATLLDRQPDHRAARLLSAWLDSSERNRFIERCRENVKFFPKDVTMRSMLACSLSYSDSTRKEGLVLFRELCQGPNNKDPGLYYQLAAAARIVGEGKEAHAADRKFVDVAPRDHRQMVKALYRLALMEEAHCDHWITRAQHAEQNGVPFLVSTEVCIEKQELLCLGKLSEPLLKFESEFRKWKLKSFDTWQVEHEKSLDDPALYHLFTDNHPNPPQPKQFDWTSLKPCRLLDFVPSAELHHDGFFLDVCVIRRPSRKRAWMTMVEDENGDVEMLSVYNAPAGFEMQFLAIGTRLRIANPYQRLSRDMASMIRVDDPTTVHILQSACSFCHKQLKSPKRCSKCKLVFYCNNECHSLHWPKHKLVCK